jgi:hypothetical protein
VTPHEVVAEIKDIIRRLIEAGLSNQQNYPSINCVGTRTNIGISGAPDIAISMKDQPYSDIYDLLDKAGAYHVKMIDGALIQMLYRFQRRIISEHRLCVFPAPFLEHYDNDPASYEQDQLYADIVSKSIVHVPIRFDYCAADALHVDVRHPKSHLTLGQYPNCRIPVNAPISPARFIKFVLRNFYHTAFHGAQLDQIDSSYQFAETLTANERAITYIYA